MHGMTALTPLTALTFGLVGSVAHCVGMCSGVLLLLHRAGIVRPQERLAAHLGRLSTYALLGLLAGWLGGALFAMIPTRPLQGLLALLLGVALIYMALTLLGYLPPVERHFPWLSDRWRRMVRHWGAAERHGLLASWGVGMVWGLLPCGFVYTMLLAAAAGGTPQHGLVVALAFGVGTIPALEGARRLFLSGAPRWRYGARLLSGGLLLIVAVQLMLRGLAWWGLIGNGRLGGVMVW